MSDNKLFHMKGTDEDHRYTSLCGVDVTNKGNKEWLTDENRRVTCPECKKKLPAQEAVAPKQEKKV